MVLAVTPGLLPNIPLPIFNEKGPCVWLLLNDWNSGGGGCDIIGVDNEALLSGGCDVISGGVDDPSGVGRGAALRIIPGGRPLAGI